MISEAALVVAVGASVALINVGGEGMSLMDVATALVTVLTGLGALMVTVTKTLKPMLDSLAISRHEQASSNREIAAALSVQSEALAELLRRLPPTP